MASLFKDGTIVLVSTSSPRDVGKLKKGVPLPNIILDLKGVIVVESKEIDA